MIGFFEGYAGIKKMRMSKHALTLLINLAPCRKYERMSFDTDIKEKS